MKIEIQKIMLGLALVAALSNYAPCVAMSFTQIEAKLNALQKKTAPNALDLFEAKKLLKQPILKTFRADSANGKKVKKWTQSFEKKQREYDLADRAKEAELEATFQGKEVVNIQADMQKLEAEQEKIEDSLQKWKANSKKWQGYAKSLEKMVDELNTSLGKGYVNYKTLRADYNKLQETASTQEASGSTSPTPPVYQAELPSYEETQGREGSEPITPVVKPGQKKPKTPAEIAIEDFDPINA